MCCVQTLSCQCWNEIVSLSFDSSRFLEVQLIGNPEPFPWPRPDGQAPEKNQCGSVSSSGQRECLFGQQGGKVTSGPTEWPGPGVALLLSKTSLSPPSRWEFWVFSETDSPVWLSELSPPASTGSVESYPWYSPEILWLWSQQRFFLLRFTCGIHLKPPVSKCRAVLRDSSCQPSKVGLGDFSGHWFARMKKSPCRSAGIYSRKW